MSQQRFEQIRPDHDAVPDDSGHEPGPHLQRFREVFGHEARVQTDLEQNTNTGTPDAPSPEPMVNYEYLNVDDELRNNAQALDEMDARGAQEYLDEIHAQDPVLVQPTGTQICACCIDERQRNGTAYGSAGAGILLDSGKRDAMAFALVDQAEALWGRNGGKTVNISAKHHGNDKCGAAAKALADGGTPAKNPGDVDAKATEGSTSLSDAVRREIARRNLGAKVTVDSGQYPEETFLQSHHHPAGAALVSTDNGLVYNQSRKRGPLLYNIGSLAGEDVAMSDAFLAAMIATGAHGMNHGPNSIPLPAGLAFRIIIAGTEETVTRLAEKYRAELAANPAYEALRSAVKIDTWVRS